MKITVTSLKSTMSPLQDRNKSRRKGIILCLLLVSLVLYGPALSQPKPSVAKDSLLFKEGETLFAG